MVTQSGEAKAVLQDVASYEATQETLALLKILALGHLGIKDSRLVFFKPYRLTYRVMGHDLVVFIIADGRRDMPALLGRRLLDA